MVSHWLLCWWWNIIRLTVRLWSSALVCFISTLTTRWPSNSWHGPLGVSGMLLGLALIIVRLAVTVRLWSAIGSISIATLSTWWQLSTDCETGLSPVAQFLFTIMTWSSGWLSGCGHPVLWQSNSLLPVSGMSLAHISMMTLSSGWLSDCDQPPRSATGGCLHCNVVDIMQSGNWLLVWSFTWSFSILTLSSG
jgi:hypothetical protein